MSHGKGNKGGFAHPEVETNLILQITKGAMLLPIANDEPWGSRPLRGDWADHRECHIG